VKRPTKTFDLREAIIPFSLLQITNLFYRMPAGETIEIIGNDASIAEDLQRILSAPDCEWISDANPRPCGDMFHILIRKRLAR
jgi:TusA-related sulfurtransferase